jgi:toxin CcdB
LTARFDVHLNPDRNGYLLNVQADLRGRLNRRVVVPLWLLGGAPTPMARLEPVLPVQGTETVMVTQLLAAVPVSILAVKVANLDGRRDQIVDALDFLYQGF